MLSAIGKTSLVICSLAPVSVGCSIIYLDKCPRDWYAGIGLLVGGLLAAAVSVALINACARRLQGLEMTVTKVKPADKESLSFLVVYLLPLAWRDAVSLPSNWVVAGYVLFVLVVVVAHSNSFTFNPVLSLWRYHFYEVEDGQGGCFILVSKKPAATPKQALRVVQLSPGVFLDTAS